MTADSVPTGINFPAEEEKILEYWKSIDAFRTSLRLSEGKKPYSFYDGPPFATGLPHYGHILAGTIKDVITRYAHLTGHHVERRFGWDCHGLPVEHEIDKTFNITGPADVAKMGIANYNAECRKIVMRYSHEWEKIVARTGRWIDFQNDYKTLDTSFMETEWWVFKQLYDKGQVYRDWKVMAYSTGCCTPLSNFEAQQNYKDTPDPSVIVSFPLAETPEVKLLAWTTTPWTLTSTLTLCVNPDLDYVKIVDEKTEETWVLAESCLGILYKDPKKAKFRKLETFKGVTMKGLEFEPPFRFFYEKRKDGAFRVLVDGYVEEGSGTGVVQNAPAFGEDDYRIALEAGIISRTSLPPNPLDAEGKFTSEVPDFEGMYIKDADKLIIKALKARGRLVDHKQFTHSYPFCWRSDTPLIYRMVPSWFIKVKDIREKLVENASKTLWTPEFVKEKRFKNWIINSRDWNVSRNRYWGTPIPLWVSEDYEEIVCVGSIEELKRLSGYAGEITDLHRHQIDHITIPSQRGKGTLRRVEEVFDCWFESGSMPYAQQHYPFENKEKFEKCFPADFIAEGLDQTRGWFYTLTVLGTHLFGTAPFKNLICNGLVLAQDGKKMSKRLKNYPEPMMMVNKYGADALRLYLISSPAVRAESLRFTEQGLKHTVSKALLPWWNAFQFFLQQAHLFEKEARSIFVHDHSKVGRTNVMDRWILASTQSLIKFVREEMAGYRLYTVVPRLLRFLEDLTNWYVRFNRRRLKGQEGPEDRVHSLNTIFAVLLTVCQTMAAFTPFLCEKLYQTLYEFLPTEQRKVPDIVAGTKGSIHFLSFPSVEETLFDVDIERQVSGMQSVIELARGIREKNLISLKIPLKTLVILSADETLFSDLRPLNRYIEEELNVRTILYEADEDKWGAGYKLEADFKKLGVRLKRKMPEVKKAMGLLSSDEVKDMLKSGNIVVAGETLTADEVKIVKTITPQTPTMLPSTDGAVTVILDTVLYPALQREGLVREIANRVQRFRKKLGLRPVDDIDVYYAFPAKPSTKDGKLLYDVLTTDKESVENALKSSLREYKGPTQNDGQPREEGFVGEEEQEIFEAPFWLKLVRSRAGG